MTVNLKSSNYYLKKILRKKNIAFQEQQQKHSKKNSQFGRPTGWMEFIRFFVPVFFFALFKFNALFVDYF